MKRKLIIFVFLLVAGMPCTLSVNAQGNGNSNKPTACQFRTDMRKLWEDHITWTRNVIFNIIDTLPGTNEAVARLLQNQVDIGNAIKPYYGNAAGTQLTTYLTHHITIAADILGAMRTGNTTMFNTAYNNWVLNADSIAAFLAAANPNWDLNDLTGMLHDHLTATANEASARLNMDYAADVAAYDNVVMQAMDMADMLSSGIVAQFPNKFRGSALMRISLQGNDVRLEQNAPNPFAESTTISYYVPETVNEAQINIYDVAGRLLQKISVGERGAGDLIVDTHNLADGVYTYSIIADGKLVDTKRMIHQQ